MHSINGRYVGPDLTRKCGDFLLQERTYRLVGKRGELIVL